jgi:hypothetical protein
MLAHAEHVARASGASAERSLARPADRKGEMGGVVRLEVDERVRPKWKALICLEEICNTRCDWIGIP